jgi:hypothetical protein
MDVQTLTDCSTHSKDYYHLSPIKGKTPKAEHCYKRLNDIIAFLMVVLYYHPILRFWVERIYIIISPKCEVNIDSRMCGTLSKNSNNRCTPHPLLEQLTLKLKPQLHGVEA